MKLNRLIDIDLFPNRDVIYGGFCIKDNKQILILINYDFKTKRFDGFSVFKQKDIVAYRNWNEKEISKIKDDNRSEFVNKFDFEQMKTFYSCFKVLAHSDLIAFFIDDSTDSYYEGKIMNLTREIVKMKLLNKKGKWTRDLELKINDINYFSFSTEYEKKLTSNGT